MDINYEFLNNVDGFISDAQSVIKDFEISVAGLETQLAAFPKRSKCEEVKSLKKQIAGYEKDIERNKDSIDSLMEAVYEQDLIAPFCGYFKDKITFTVLWCKKRNSRLYDGY